MKLFIALLAIIPVLAFGVSGEETAPVTETTDSSSALQEKEAPQAEGGILLPDGWEISDAVSAEEVEIIMKTPGFSSFAQGANSPSSGRPVGSYNLPGTPYSGVRFDANVAGGQQAYDTAAGYLTDTKEIDGPKWDSALMGEVKAGKKTQMRMLVLKGDQFFMISWVPEVFPELAPEETNVELAELLITNLYGE
ncbi:MULTISPECIES: hypothetical protein [Thiorhodovibrio]|uniref:hypothetical protein n=1 Tax=Thiorhodovibrio TaxID=61593 RepID=UPI001914CAE6|nr:MULTISPECIES: hypothetical protein [Thiorhodovibrio]MBK5970013.1 hypothetical protein [Thiorhodovibrio winogradskyi]WPL12935.1 hypothetical protein Thiosp_02720 [Thiorhodovibrio litoralis]